MIAGIILDLDGTLTEPGLIDFSAMRRAIGCPEGQTILEYLEVLRSKNPIQWQEAKEEVERREIAAAHRIRPAANLTPFLAWLNESGLRRAIITRNARATALLSLDLLGLTGMFDPVLAREDARPKPAPDGILLIARQWKVRPESLVMIGDFRHDIEAGNAAGVRTVLCTGGKSLPSSSDAHRVVVDLMEIPDLVRQWSQPE